ncbi:MAG: hypothetical protein P1P76_11850 [Anaerolineales bacterium]|nr:hypothetical protein [Anaerolineales bacterium]
MLHFLYGIFVILHGLVHLWYVTLSQSWVPFKPDMGWTGKSWLITNAIGDSATRSLAALIYTLITIAFVGGGIGLLVRSDWWTSAIIGAATASTIAILVFWDGSPAMLVQKGLLGLLINLALLASILLFD